MSQDERFNEQQAGKRAFARLCCLVTEYSRNLPTSRALSREDELCSVLGTLSPIALHRYHFDWVLAECERITRGDGWELLDRYFRKEEVLTLVALLRGCL